MIIVVNIMPFTFFLEVISSSHHTKKKLVFKKQTITITIIIIVFALYIINTENVSRTFLSGNQFTLNTDYGNDPLSTTIGNQKFQSLGLKYVCSPPGNIISIEGPCWEGKATFEGQTYTFKIDETININNFLSFVYKPHGRWNSKDALHADDYKESYTFKIDFDGLNTQIESFDDQISLGQSFNLPIRINNQIVDGLIGGFNLRKKGGLLFSDTTSLHEVTFKKGISTYSIPVLVEELGIFEYVITPFIIVEGHTLTSSLSVQEEIIQTTESEEQTLQPIPDEQIIIKSAGSTNSSNMISTMPLILIVSLLIGITILIIKKWS